MEERCSPQTHKGRCHMDIAADRLTLSLPSQPRYLCVLQGFFGSLLTGLSFSSSEGMQVTLAVHEACTNIMEHDYQAETAQRIDRTVLITPEELAVGSRHSVKNTSTAVAQVTPFVAV